MAPLINERQEHALLRLKKNQDSSDAYSGSSNSSLNFHTSKQSNSWLYIYYLVCLQPARRESDNNINYYHLF